MVGRGVPAEPFDEERLTRRVRPTCENVIAFDGNIIIFLIHFQTGENRPFLTGRDIHFKQEN
jgi:hypothetical protein